MMGAVTGGADGIKIGGELTGLSFDGKGFDQLSLLRVPPSDRARVS
jgi:hypothetical protein